MNDGVIFKEAIEAYTGDVLKSLFGISGFGTQTLIKIAANNLYDKYGNYLQFFIDKDGNFIDEDAVFEAMKEVMKDGYTFAGVKFTKDDVEDLKKAFTKIKDKN